MITATVVKTHNGIVQLQAQPCSWTRCTHKDDRAMILVTVEEYKAYNQGALIQNAFPTLSTNDREQLMTGIHPDCWDEMWKEDDDDGSE